VDGVILRKGSASATFLPQVWEQLPQPEKFLSHLCTKACLSSDAWKKGHLEILTYQVQYFEEEK
jgi:AMMECR1 domain-containing protein